MLWFDYCGIVTLVPNFSGGFLSLRCLPTRARGTTRADGMLSAKAHILAARARVVASSANAREEQRTSARVEVALLDTRRRAALESACFERWWTTSRWFSTEAGLNYEQYAEAVARVLRACDQKGADGDEEEVRQAVLMDWSLECGGDHKARCSKERFLSALYALGEVWWPHPEPEPLITFLGRLFDAITEPSATSKAEHQTRVWRPLDAINRGGFLSEELQNALDHGRVADHVADTLHDHTAAADTRQQLVGQSHPALTTPPGVPMYSSAPPRSPPRSPPRPAPPKPSSPPRPAPARNFAGGSTRAPPPATATQKATSTGSPGRAVLADAASWKETELSWLDASMDRNGQPAPSIKSPSKANVARAPPSSPETVGADDGDRGGGARSTSPVDSLLAERCPDGSDASSSAHRALQRGQTQSTITPSTTGARGRGGRSTIGDTICAPWSGTTTVREPPLSTPVAAIVGVGIVHRPAPTMATAPTLSSSAKAVASTITPLQSSTILGDMPDVLRDAPSSQTAAAAAAERSALLRLATFKGDGAAATRLSMQMTRLDGMVPARSGGGGGSSPANGLQLGPPHRWIFSPLLLIPSHFERCIAPLPQTLLVGAGAGASTGTGDGESEAPAVIAPPPRSTGQPASTAQRSASPALRPSSPARPSSPVPRTASPTTGAATNGSLAVHGIELGIYATAPQRATLDVGWIAGATSLLDTPVGAHHTSPQARTTAGTGTSSGARVWRAPPRAQSQHPRDLSEWVSQQQLAHQTDSAKRAGVPAMRGSGSTATGGWSGSRQHGPEEQVAAIAKAFDEHLIEQQQTMRLPPSASRPGRTLLWRTAGAALAGWQSLRELVVGANRRASELVALGQYARAESLLRPALYAVRQASLLQGWPVQLLRVFSALNAASLCGMHLAGGDAHAAMQAGATALEMEHAKGDGDNPVGVRLSVAAAAHALGQHATAVNLLRQAARIGLQWLRSLQRPTDLRPSNATRVEVTEWRTFAPEDASVVELSRPMSEVELATWIRRALEPIESGGTQGVHLTAEALEARLAAPGRFAHLSEGERKLLVVTLQHAMIVVYLHLAQCFRAQGRDAHLFAALQHAARLCEAGGTATAHLMPTVMSHLQHGPHAQPPSVGALGTPAKPSAAPTLPSRATTSGKLQRPPVVGASAATRTLARPRSAPGGIVARAVNGGVAPAGANWTSSRVRLQRNALVQAASAPGRGPRRMLGTRVAHGY